MDDVLPKSDRPETEALIEGIALIMDTALTPAGADPEAGKAIVRQIADSTRAQLGLIGLLPNYGGSIDIMGQEASCRRSGLVKRIGWLWKGIRNGGWPGVLVSFCSLL